MFKFIMKNKNENYLIFFKCKNILLVGLILFILSSKPKKKEIKIALCTMGKRENLYAKEFINYYIKLGVDKIFNINLQKAFLDINPSLNFILL